MHSAVVHPLSVIVDDRDRVSVHSAIVHHLSVILDETGFQSIKP